MFFKCEVTINVWEIKYLPKKNSKACGNTKATQPDTRAHRACSINKRSSRRLVAAFIDEVSSRNPKMAKLLRRRSCFHALNHAGESRPCLRKPTELVR